MLCSWEVLECSIIHLPGFCDVPLFGQELCIVNPDPWHEAHVDKALFVKIVDSLVVFGLGDQIELLHIESCLFEIVEPELVAARQVSQSSLVQACTVFKVIDRLGHDGVPPRPEIVDVGHSRRLSLQSLQGSHSTYISVLAVFIWCHEELLLELGIFGSLHLLKFCR